ncbi:unnamed protein product [Rodentolepis nana]|uniref:Transcriptional regulator n=1 Tax=Rodentolepis nana TaxID=102285 RepID=A0A0R3TR74_RODNA|nr:unnamed protein product [Rodentolepis nana]
MKSYDRSYSRGNVPYGGHFMGNPRSNNAKKLSDRLLPQGKNDAKPSNFSTKGNYQDRFAPGQPVLQCAGHREAIPMDPSFQYSAYAVTLQKRVSREHDVVVLAVNPALKAYGQAIAHTIELFSGRKGQDFLQDFFAEQQSQGAKPRQFHYRRPTVFQVCLGGENYVEPCIMDFNDKGYLYAIICNEANKLHNSVTLRILHSDQEHRNMSTVDSLNLLFSDFYSYIHAECDYLATGPLPPSTPIVDNHPPPLPSTKENQQVPPPHQILPAPQQLPEVNKSQLEPNSSKLPSQCRLSPPSLTRRHESGQNSIGSHSRKRHRSSRSSSHSSSRSGARGYSHHFGPPKSSHHGSPSSLRGPHQRQPKDDVEIPVPDDPNFLVPSKRMSALLKMLADSRILSAAELDEIAKFVAERKARLNSTVEEHMPVGNISNDVLKARILETIYNQTPTPVSKPGEGFPQSQLQLQQQSSQLQLPFQTQQLGFSSSNRALLESSHSPPLPSLSNIGPLHSFVFSGPTPILPSFTSNATTSNLTSIPTRGPSQPPSLLSRQKSLPMSRGSNNNNNPNNTVTSGLIAYTRLLRDILETYARSEGPYILEKILKEQPEKRALLPSNFAFRLPDVIEYVISDENYIEPSLVNFVENGALYAIVATQMNEKCESCSLRILRSDRHEEHRNMPRLRAIELMVEDYAECIVNLALEKEERIENTPPEPPKTPLSKPSDSLHSPVSTYSEVILSPHIPVSVSSQLKRQPEPPITSPEQKRRRHHHSPSSRSNKHGSSANFSKERVRRRRHSSFRSGRDIVYQRTKKSSRRQDNVKKMEEADEIPPPVGPHFVAPSKHLSSLLYKLADSRFLSRGELYEIEAFVHKRIMMLTNGRFYRVILSLE